MQGWKRSAIAASVAVIGLGILVTWDLYVNPKITEATIVVAKTTIFANHTILSTDLTKEKTLRINIVPNEIMNKQDLIGKVATTEIGQGLPFMPYMISQNDLVPNEIHSTYPISPNWIQSVPSTLRRGDHVNLFLVPAQQGMITVYTGTPAAVLGNPFLTNIPVEYVLNSQGQEITDLNPSNTATSDENRQNSTGNINQIELLLTKKQGRQLLKACTVDHMQLYFVDLNS